MEKKLNRRKFLQSLGISVFGLPLAMSACNQKVTKNTVITTANSSVDKALFFKISLAEWSLHKALYAKQMTNLDFPVMAKKDFGISAVEYVNQFWKDKAKDQNYLKELKMRCDDNGVRSVLIMCDGEGNLGDADDAKRQQAVENHFRWVEAAKYLGCHSIRVNAAGSGTAEQVAVHAADGLRRLSEFAKPYNVGVIVENHGGYSSNGKWLSGVMKSVNMPNCGTLPDFGNFCVKRDSGEAWGGKCVEEYDRYLGVSELMPFAKGVSAKTYDFDEKGNCIETDYMKMMKVIKEAKYTGYVGIEYEGSIAEPDGIRKTLALLRQVGGVLS